MLGRRPRVRSRADDHAHRRRRVPAQGRGAGDERVVAAASGMIHIGQRAADDRVDDQRLQAGVPGPAGLRRSRVGGRGGERHAAPEAQHALDEHPVLVVVRRQRREALLEDVGRDADELDGPAQRQAPREVARRDAERLGRQPDGLARLVQPRDEVGDPPLGHEQHGGTLVRGEPAEPGLAVHRRQTRRSQVTRRQLETPPRGGGDRPAVLDRAAAVCRVTGAGWGVRGRTTRRRAVGPPSVPAVRVESAVPCVVSRVA